MSNIKAMNVTRYVSLGQAYELAIRLNELYEAIQLVESCGASVELTNAVTKLGKRMDDTQGDLVRALTEATTWSWERDKPQQEPKKEPTP